MADDFEARVLRAQEGKLRVSLDQLLMYERQRGVMEKKFEAENDEYHAIKESVRKWKDDVNIQRRVIQTMREVAGIPADAPILTPVEPVQEEVEAKKPASSFQGASGSNEQQLLAALRKAKGWRMGIPIAPSYRNSPSSFTHQALSRTIANHVDYEAHVKAGNIICVTDSTLGHRGKAELYRAAQILGLDPDAVRRDAYNAFFDLTTYGKSGEHYQW